MANLIIEDELLALIDASTWTVGSQGLTKSTYIHIESHSHELDLWNPPLVDDEATIVIHKSSTVPIQKSLGSDIKSFVGTMVVVTNTTATMKLAINNLKIIADSDPNLDFMIPGIDGDSISNEYNIIISYKWDRHISH